MEKSHEMKYKEAQDVIEEAVTDMGGLAEITTAPTNKQWEALQAIEGSTDIAPRHICESMGLFAGTTWGEIALAIGGDLVGEEVTSLPTWDEIGGGRKRPARKPTAFAPIAVALLVVIAMAVWNSVGTSSGRTTSTPPYDPSPAAPHHGVARPGAGTSHGGGTASNSGAGTRTKVPSVAYMLAAIGGDLGDEAAFQAVLDCILESGINGAETETKGGDTLVASWQESAQRESLLEWSQALCFAVS